MLSLVPPTVTATWASNGSPQLTNVTLSVGASDGIDATAEPPSYCTATISVFDQLPPNVPFNNSLLPLQVCLSGTPVTH
jgi:hypothetical protein